MAAPRRRQRRKHHLLLRAHADPEPATHALEHQLHGVLEALAGFSKRRQMLRSTVYQRHYWEIAQLLSGLEWDVRTARRRPAMDPAGRRGFRAVAWNVERGKRFEALTGRLAEDPMLREADLFLLTEVDVGMGRSGNRNVPQELADRLGTDYVFANHHLCLSKGDWNEREHVDANTLAMHGSALLSRYPIRRFVSVALPEYLDKFHHLEKRLGCKRALIAEVELPDGPLTVAVVHLDPFAPPRHRAWQLHIVNSEIARFGGHRVLLGGDLNTMTYNLANGPSLFFDIMRKLMTVGVDGVVAEYLAPWTGREQVVFDEIQAAGFEFHGFNELDRGTLFCDTYDPELVRKAKDYLPDSVFRWLQRKLDPWEGMVPLRPDWFAGRGLRPISAKVVHRPTWRGTEISDHSPILLDFEPEEMARPVLRRKPRLPRPKRAYLRRHERGMLRSRKPHRGG